MSSMIEVKVAELEGAALDWAVAKAVGLVAYTQPDGPVYRPDNGEEWTPATDWSQGGPLIEKLDFGLLKIDHGVWSAIRDMQYFEAIECYAESSTPLIAAMRAIVAAELGETVQVPAELVEAS